MLAVAGPTARQAQTGMPEGRPQDVLESEFFGLTLLKAIHSEFPDLPVVILSSQTREKVSQFYSEYGALAFLPRTNGGNGDTLLSHYLDRHGLMPDPHGLIIGNSFPLLKALRAARRTAYREDRDNILIRGERGVGKEEFAQFIHRAHPSRSKEKLVSVNSAVLTSDLFQSELFGIDKNFATGVDQRDGAALIANNGDLFLDEIKDMIPQAQAGVLRFLEAGNFTPMGSKASVSSNVRVISATNADLETLAATGRFREDLLDRLRRGGKIVLPPLRQRKEDIPLLARAFVRQLEARQSSAARGASVANRVFSDEAMEWLIDENWPGNVRQLRDVIQKVVLDNDVEFIFPSQLEKACESLGVARQRKSSVEGDFQNAPLPYSKLPASPPSAVESKIPSSVDDSAAPKSLDELISAINQFKFDNTQPETLRGKLDPLEEATAMLVIRFLESSLAINKDKVNDEVVPTAAARFLTAKTISGTAGAYDLIKRIIKRNKNVREEALKNPVLKLVFQKAEAGRATRSKRSDS